MVRPGWRDGTVSPFETEDARVLNEARRDFLSRLLTELRQVERLETALDIGCGALGFFSRLLVDVGFRVVGMDGRVENVSEAGRRNPDIDFKVQDVESWSIMKHGRFDFVLCFGLLYHLENPFLAIRNLQALTSKLLLIETQVAPMRGLGAILYEEGQSPNQSLRYVALMPSELAVVKMLYKAGFASVFRSLELPDHWQFRSSPEFRKMRTVLLASNEDQMRSQWRWGGVEFEYMKEPRIPLLSVDTWRTEAGRVIHLLQRAAARVGRGRFI